MATGKDIEIADAESNREDDPSEESVSMLSDIRLFVLAVASAIVTANAYYIHPIIAPVAADFGVDQGLIGIVPGANQLALALGVFLLLPLGDWFSNRKLVTLFASLQCLALAAMAVAADFRWFLAASTMLGFFTIAPYLLPAYVSRRVPVNRLGHANAVLTTGIIVGILIARAGSGVIAEHFGWRAVYYIATLLMAGITLSLPFIMEERWQSESIRTHRTYRHLIGSILPIVRDNREILVSGAIQGMSFGIFLAIWMGLGLHLTSPEMGFGVDVVGYLALLAMVNVFTTPVLGRWADRIAARRARMILACVQIFGVCLFWPFGHSLWLLMIPIVITNIAGPAMDVTSRITFLSQAPEIRTRLMTVYIVLMFAGGGIGSWAGTAVYDWAGWTGNAVLAICFSTVVLLLSAVGLFRYGGQQGDHKSGKAA
ncbi:MAG: MFS transporter [Pseudomonadota bacterium]